MKEYFYTNDLGFRKKFEIIYKREDGTYSTAIWSMNTGDLCGGGNMTKEEIIDFLKHYGIKADF